MKITTLITIDMATGQVLEHQSFEYDGPVALCGGSSHQNDSKVAAASSAGAEAQAQESAAYEKQLQGQQSQQYNNLFGADGKSGTLSKMADPSSLNVTAPTGAYALQYSQDRGKLATSMANQRGSLANSMSNRGFGNGSPSGTYADSARQLALGQASAEGNMYSDYTNRSYADALSNFWNANNIAAGQSATSMAGANTAGSNVSSTYDNLYGTAGQVYQTPGIGSSIMGAIGTIGGAAVSKATLCPMVGSLITMADGSFMPVEELKEGDEVLGFNSEVSTLTSDPVMDDLRCVGVSFNDNHAARVSFNSPFLIVGGGSVQAADSYGLPIVTDSVSSQVTFINDLGVQTIVHLPLDGSHTYYADGVLHLI